MDIFQKRNLEGTGADYPCVMKDDWPDKLLKELRTKRRVYHLWKEGQATQGMFKGVTRSRRKKIRETKAQLEPTYVKGNKNIFVNT